MHSYILSEMDQDTSGESKLFDSVRGFLSYSHQATFGTVAFLTSCDSFLTLQNKALADLLLVVVPCQENYRGRELYNMATRV